MDNVININPTSPKLNVMGTDDEGVIKLNITPIDIEPNTQKSVNFGPGADLLMNQGRASRQNSPKSEIKLSEINSLGLEPKKTTPQERSNMMLSGDSAIKLNIGSLDKDIKILKTPMASLNPLLNSGTPEKINLGKSTGGEKNTETWDGYKKFNEIPVDPTAEPPIKPKLSEEEILKQKFSYIRKLEALEKQGITVSRKYNMDDKLEEMKGEYEMIKSDIGKRNSVKFQGKMLLAFASGIEFLNSKFDPFDINIDGWGEAVNENISEYDEVFGELHEKYGSKAKMAPELKLLFMLGGSAGMLHMTNTMFKSSMPGMDDIMKQNPDLAHQFTQAAAQSMGQQNPGFGNFMGSMMPNMSQPPPRPQPTYDNRPDIDDARGAQKSKREMKGPSDIDDILAGIKTKSKKINVTTRDHDDSSTISITELKELQQENLNGIPGKSKRRPRSERNTLNLNI